MSFIIESRGSDSPLIETVWRTESAEAGSFISSADIHCGIVLTRYQGKTTVTVKGPETKASPASFPADAEYFGIVFRPGTFLPHLLPKHLADRRDFVLPDASSKTVWLQGSVWELPSFENADTFVNRMAREDLLVHDAIVTSVLQEQPQSLSVRAVQYRFLRATGMTYSTAYQITRAQRAVTLLRKGISILDTVYEAGYYDQAHLTRSLKRFAGQTPAQVS
ncbi:MAG: AraC family transcriptional regulator [Anaerolineae bacterium]|nr:AraC family transcriptional regulator [Anaerolineae bacterium]